MVSQKVTWVQCVFGHSSTHSYICVYLLCSAIYCVTLLNSFGWLFIRTFSCCILYIVLPVLYTHFSLYLYFLLVSYQCMISLSLVPHSQGMLQNARVSPPSPLSLSFSRSITKCTTRETTSLSSNGEKTISLARPSPSTCSLPDTPSLSPPGPEATLPRPAPHCTSAMTRAGLVVDVAAPFD